MSSQHERVAALLNAAGLPLDGAAIAPLPSHGAINTHELVTLSDGRRYVIREYSWPFDEPNPIDRQAKEEWLLPLLERHGVRAPRLLARADGAILMSFVEGRLLAETRSAEAWRAAGENLRKAHELVIGARAGIATPGGVEPFQQGSWGRWNAAMALMHASAVAPAHVNAVEHIFDLATPMLDTAPMRLSHNDAHAWNGLEDGTWLDWEFAYSADPDWDLARTDLMRISDIGPTPEAFWEGYGRRPDPVRLALYELHYYLWRAHDARDLRWHSERQARAYVAALDTHTQRLRKMLAD